MTAEYSLYGVYGLVLRSNRCIPLFRELSDGDIDTTIDFIVIDVSTLEYDLDSCRVLYSSPSLAMTDVPFLSIFRADKKDEDQVIIRYCDRESYTYFVINSTGSKVTVYCEESVHLSNVFSYLAGPVIGVVLKLKLEVCLHASVVNINSSAILFLGDKGAGKSTMVAALCKRAVPVLSDDIAVLYRKNERLYVRPGYPKVRVWGNTIEKVLDQRIGTFEKVLTHNEKYYLDLSRSRTEKYRFQENSLAVDRIVFLQKRHKGRHIVEKKYTSIQAFLALRENMYADYMSNERLLKKEFKILKEVVENCVISCISLPDDLGKLPMVYEYISNT